ncbi:MAG: hypothetical protein K0S37_13 [Microbacterium sp.]|jgi:hypothetical protein|nr:hypothetical protein [Microbacterium sp.]
MMRRSLSWFPFGAYTYFAFVVAAALTVVDVGVYLVRNGATGIYAVYFAPLYLGAFFAITEAAAIVWVVMRPRLGHLGRQLRAALVAAIAALAGVPIGYVFWWILEFEAPPVWFWVLAILASSAAYWWYTVRYELANVPDEGRR